MTKAIDPIYAVLGRSIRRRRTRAGLSQAELGELVGLSPSTMSQIECGQARVFFHVVVQIFDNLASAENVLAALLSQEKT